MRVVADRVVSMDVRLGIAAAVQVEAADVRVNVSAFCAEYDISRKTFYELRSRFVKEGLEGLVPRSRRPWGSPSQTPVSVVELIVA